MIVDIDGCSPKDCPVKAVIRRVVGCIPKEQEKCVPKE